MQVFISHNKSDKSVARMLAEELRVYGIDIWFDEWSLSLGDSISGGIEEGLANSHIFVLLWSKDANASSWVTAERRSYLTRRMSDNTLKIIPVMLDETPLPALLHDTLGYALGSNDRIPELANKIAGEPDDVELLQKIQEKFHEMSAGMDRDPIFGIVICPKCGSTDFERRHTTDDERDESYYMIRCKNCDWNDWTQ